MDECNETAQRTEADETVAHRAPVAIRRPPFSPSARLPLVVVLTQRMLWLPRHSVPGTAVILDRREIRKLNNSNRLKRGIQKGGT